MATCDVENSLNICYTTGNPWGIIIISETENLCNQYFVFTIIIALCYFYVQVGINLVL